MICDRVLTCSLASCWLLLLLSLQAQSKDLFNNHRDGYPVFRIPAIITTGSGRLLAFAEGRNNLFDHGNIDLVVKTSDDNGNTWSATKVIWDAGNNTCGNPAPVYDAITGEVLLIGTLNNEQVFLLRSKDEGVTWSTPEDITSSVKPADWSWYATGPGHAIQLEQDTYKGRIVVPCNHTLTGQRAHMSHVIYSDDHGRSWQLGGSVPTPHTDESTVAACTNGSLCLNMRNNNRTLPNRLISLSQDGGQTWSAAEHDSTLIEPTCEGVLLRYAFTPNILLFMNPAHPKKRQNLTLRISYDDGKTWQRSITICKRKAAYSDLTLLPNGDIYCIYETGKLLPYNHIAGVTIDKKIVVP